MMNNNGGMRGGGYINRGGQGGNPRYNNTRGGYNNTRGGRGGYREQRGPHQGSGNYKTVKCKFFEQSKYKF